MDNRITIQGIRNKSTSDPNKYFFSIESEDINMLKSVMQHIENMLLFQGIKYDMEKKYHD